MIHSPLNSAQLELLEMFAADIPESDWLEIKRLIVRHFAQKAIAAANEAWDKNQWTAETEQQLLQAHLRTPYLIASDAAKNRH